MIVGITGGLGSGKTLVASYLATCESRRGRPVWSNYPVYCATLVRSWSEVVSLESGVVVLDEVHVDIDSRSFGNNVEVTSFLLQTRKLDLDLIYTSQSLHQVDKRLRDITDIVMMCERVLSPDGSRASRVVVIDLTSVTVRTRFVLAHSPELYALYDTKARVYPLLRPKKLGLSG